MKRKLGLVAVLLWVSLGLWSCGKKPTSPAFPKGNQFPAQPRDLVIATGDQRATLFWNIDNPAAVKYYRLFRHDTTTTVFAFIDTAMGRRYMDRNLRNNITYFYQISAVNANGFESKRSAVATVALGSAFASIIVEAGADYVSQRSVRLKLTAPFRTRLMMLSNDSLFANASWQSFEGTVNDWILSFGDGKKTVYARFRDEDGNVLPQIVSDSIILDTTARIRQVTENTNGKVKVFGNSILFTMTTNEIGGKATINLAGGPHGILLFDDGTQGDVTRQDGIYSVNYIIPQEVQVIQAKVLGNFIDRGGNVAETVAAATQITIQRRPDAVTMFQPTAVGPQQSALRLTWTASKDTFDFANYSIYRSQTMNFNPSTATLIDRVTLMQTSGYNDLNLQAGATYYYRIVVFDLAGLNSVPSNEVNGRTNPNLPPTPVVLNTPLLIGDGSSSVQLTWTRSTDNDFASYRVHRSNSAKVDSLSILATAIANQNQTIYVDEGLKAATKYYYRIYVYDQAGNAAGSNPGIVNTVPNLPPTPVTLALPSPIDTTSLQLSWSQNNDADFVSYLIFRVNQGAPPIDPAKQQPPPIMIFNNDRTKTMYVDRGLKRKTKYVYQVFVYDKGGLYSGSNLVEGATR